MIYCTALFCSALGGSLRQKQFSFSAPAVKQTEQTVSPCRIAAVFAVLLLRFGQKDISLSCIGSRQADIVRGYLLRSAPAFGYPAAARACLHIRLSLRCRIAVCARPAWPQICLSFPGRIAVCARPARPQICPFLCCRQSAGQQGKLADILRRRTAARPDHRGAPLCNPLHVFRKIARVAHKHHAVLQLLRITGVRRHAEILVFRQPDSLQQ